MKSRREVESSPVESHQVRVLSIVWRVIKIIILIEAAIYLGSKQGQFFYQGF